jgi:hypothetical protein
MYVAFEDVHGNLQKLHGKWYINETTFAGLFLHENMYIYNIYPTSKGYGVDKSIGISQKNHKRFQEKWNMHEIAHIFVPSWKHICSYVNLHLFHKKHFLYFFMKKEYVQPQWNIYEPLKGGAWVSFLKK